MTLYEDLQDEHYLDKTYQTVSNVPNLGDGFNCDNPSLFTAEAAILCADRRETPPAFDMSYRKFFDASQVQPGLFHRFPGNVGDISVDELVGASAISDYAAGLIYAYGAAHRWVFQPQGGKFVWSAWMGRYVSIIPFLKFRATRRMNLVDQILWAIGCVISPMTPQSDTSGKLLTWVQVRKVEGNFWLTDVAIRAWRFQMKRKYPGGLKQLCTIYFSAAHPFATWSDDRF